MITFAKVDPEDELRAYAWHTDFTDRDKSVYPRKPGEFHDFIRDGKALAATNDWGDFLGLAYSTLGYDGWEVGGLAVMVEARKLGVGFHLACATLGHLLIDEHPLAEDPPRPLRVIVHVLQSNNDPRSIIEKRLRFRLVGALRIPGSRLPGLRTGPDGYVHGDEFELTVPDTLHALANWAENFDGRLGNGERAHIDLMDGVTLEQWAAAFRQMAIEARPSRSADPDDSDPSGPNHEPRPRSD